jgi:putative DNA primase/helicase
VGPARRQGEWAMTAAEMAMALAQRIDALVRAVLAAGHREGCEWRVGSVRGEPGSSLAVRLSGEKAGLWHDFATGESGDALDLVKAALGIDARKALRWSRRWIGIEDDAAAPPVRPALPPKADAPEPDPNRWSYPWGAAQPISGGTLADTYIATRRLRFGDPAGRVLQFAARRVRKSPIGELEHHPALLCALSDARTGEQCGIINIFLKADGSDRLRDKKGKTVTGRSSGAVVMLSGFDEPTTGLILCEGVETGIALFQREMRPVWACGSSSTLAKFPVLSGIEALTIAADADSPGQRAAAELGRRWRDAGREVLRITPPFGDWADIP